MNLGTAVVSLLLVVIVVAIIRSIIKDKRAGKNVGCGSCKSCAHATTSSQSCSLSSIQTSSSQITSHTISASCPSCAHIDKMLADLETSTSTSAKLPNDSKGNPPSRLSH